jgi:hypothetical protein
VMTISEPQRVGDIVGSLYSCDIDKVALIIVQFARLQANVHKFVQ